MSGIILVIFIMCYCCHKNARKQDGPVPITYWRDTGLPLHVYTVEGHRHREVNQESKQSSSFTIISHYSPLTSAKKTSFNLRIKTSFNLCKNCSCPQQREEPPFLKKYPFTSYINHPLSLSLFHLQSAKA